MKTPVDPTPTKPPVDEEIRSVCGSSDPANGSWLGLQRFVAETERMLGATLRTYGLNQAQFAMLLTIGSAEGMNQQDIAERRGLTKANVSQLLNRLEDAGLIKRVPENRSYAIHLTSVSRQVLLNSVPEQQAVIREQFSSLSAQELIQLQRLVQQLVPETGTMPLL